MMTLTLDMRSADLALSEAEFYRLCQANRNMRLELTAEGHLILMPPTGWETGSKNFDLNYQFGAWVKRDGTGIGFDSSTGFRLPNGAVRSPDVAWVKRSRIEAINPDPKKFLPLCPDFVIELRSASDRLIDTQNKMQEYLDNGLLLGWLISPQNKTIEIYQQDTPVDTRALSGTVSGDPVLPGLQLNLSEIF